MTGAILLAGGRARRVDGAAKPLFEVGGTTLLQRALNAVAGCEPVTVVADPVPGVNGASWVREDPPFGGPAAAVSAALASWTGTDPEWTVVLACDLPGAVPAVQRLIEAALLLPADADGVCLGDAGSRPQWLTGLYRTASLRRGAAALSGGGRDASMRQLLADAAVTVLVAPAEETADVDTWEDLDRARGADARAEEER